jgi:uncharacterized protein (TIGR01777 family)
MKVLISGGTGFIGRSLIRTLIAAGHHVVLLSRNPGLAKKHLPPEVLVEEWDGRTGGTWSANLQGVHSVFNLAGEPIAGKRWTAAQKIKIRSSRMDATRALIASIADRPDKPAVLINASAVGYYGNVNEGEVSEAHRKGSGFLSDTVDAWEEESTNARKHGVRVVFLRTGIVLGTDGGALPKLLLPFRIFVGGHIGTGMQWFPWIHKDDVIGGMLFAAENSLLSGPVNLVSPNPVRMRDFCAALGRAMRRPSWMHVPELVLKTLLGEMSEMLLTGQRAVPGRLLSTGFQFRFPTLDPALKNILGGGDQKSFLRN